MEIRLIISNEVEVRHRRVIGNGEQFPRDHHGGQKEDEDDVPSAELQTSKGKRSENGGQ